MKRVLPAILILAATLLLASPAPSQSIIRSWNVPPTSSAFVGGVAFDPINGTIWTMDETNDLIQQFTRIGKQLQSLPAPIPPNSGLSNAQPIGACIDPVTGNLWIADEGEYVYELTQAGKTTGRSWSTKPSITDASAIAFDPATRSLYVSNDSGKLIGHFDTTGKSIRTFSVSGAGSSDPDGLAYNPVTGTFYLGEDTGDQIIEVDPTGKLIKSWSMTSLGLSPEGLAVDTRSGSLFVGGGAVNRSVSEVAGIVPACQGAITAYGQGCPDSGNMMPILGASDCPTIGRTFCLGEWTSPTVTASALFLAGITRGSIPLAFLGAPKCSLLLSPRLLLDLGAVPIKEGRAGVTLPLPNSTALKGFKIPFHCLNFPDVGVPGQISMPGGLEITIQ